MKITGNALVVIGLAHQAAATWDFFASPILNTPKYNSNECDAKQRDGFNWADLKEGATNFKYGDFDFSSGWSCSTSIGKRDRITRRTFGPKMIKNIVSKDKPASFSCDKRSSGFSITDMDISTEFDTELELHYNMPGGSKCKQYASCSRGGTTLKNTQCGGALSVDVYLGSYYKGGQSQCEIGLHNIGFDCKSGDKYTPPKYPETPATSTPVASQIVSTTPSTEASAPPCSGGKCDTVPPASSTSSSCNGKEGNCGPQPPQTSTDDSTTTPAAETPASTTTSCGENGGVCNTSVQTPPSYAPYSTVVSFPNGSTPAYTSPASSETSQISYPSLESSYVSSPPKTDAGEPTPPTQKSSTMTPTCGKGGPCEGSTAQVSSSPGTGTPAPHTSTAVAPPSGPSYAPASPPAQLASCMNTWLQISTKCKDNTDKSCYCINPEFTKNVIDCVSAWCGTEKETTAALQYLVGICAEYVPQNPKIIEDCPAYLPLNPTTTAPAAGPTGGAIGGVGITVALSETPMSETPCTTIAYGSTSITVPLVHFSTQSNVAGAIQTEPVGLVPGTAPAQIPASTTGGIYPVPSTMGTRTGAAGTGTGALRPSAPVAQFTGMASLQTVPGHVMLGAAFAFLVL